MGKRLVVVGVVVAMLGGAYAAGATGPSAVSGHELRVLKAISRSEPQTFKISQAGPKLINGARLALNVRAGESGIFDIRFTERPQTTSDLPGDILVDGVPLAPVGWYFFGGTFPQSIERITAPLPAGLHVITVQIDAPSIGAFNYTLGGWTLVAEEVKAN